MAYPSNYFPTPSRRLQKRGVITEIETNWGTYTIVDKNGKVEIEANGWGGAQRRMPKVDSVQEARQVVWDATKPIDQSEIIKF